MMRADALALPRGEAGAHQLSWAPTARQFCAILIVYYGLHLVLRSLVSETVGIDEADQVVVGQGWSWGYGPQPPLFTWLAMAVLEVLPRPAIRAWMRDAGKGNQRNLCRSSIC